MVYEGMVSKNVRANLTCEVSNVKSGLGFLILSCFFGLGSQNRDRLVGILFFNDGARGCCFRHLTYKLPIVGNIFFLMQN
jgi:hypothetical protein